MPMNKKQLYSCFGCFVLSVSLCFSMAPSLPSSISTVSAASLPGSGTETSPYQIASPEDLSTFRDIVISDSDAYAVLTNDITVSGSWTPIADYNEGLVFSGTFDGDGHTITISSGSETSNYQGLFGYNEGSIKDVTVAGTVTGSEYAGGIAAINKGTIENAANQAAVTSADPVAFAGGIAAINYGDIKNSQNTGTVIGKSAGSCTGGIAGAAPSGSITGSHNEGAITGENANTIEEYNEACVGGITGLNYQSTISISYNAGSVSSTDKDSYAGGIAGLNNGAISDCYNSAAITGPSYAGGIAGYLFFNKNAGDSSLKNSFNYGTVTDTATHHGAVYGGNYGGHSYNNYYLADQSSASHTADTLGVTQEELKSGKVTYWLNENQMHENVIWRQTLATDTYPSFSGSIVYGIFEDGTIKTYSNEKPEHVEHKFDKNGTCTECKYQSVSLEGYSLTLDGGIGNNTYYYIDPVFFKDPYKVEVTFTLDGKDAVPKTVALDPDFSQFNSEKQIKMYGFPYYVNSYEMNLDITPVLSIKKDNDVIIEITGEKYRVYSYLKELYKGEDEKLKDLAQSLATLDYYSSEHFQYNPHYEPDVDLPLKAIDKITADTLKDYEKTFEGNAEDYPVSHYADSLLFHSFVTGKYYAKVTGDVSEENLYMGFRPHGNETDYTYVKTTKSGNYFYGYTDQIPAADLSALFDVAFFEKKDGQYTQVSNIKISGPYSYLYSMLSKDQQESMKNVSRALYLYGESARDYFSTQNQ